MRGSRALLKMLEDRGVTKIFGYPGGSVLPVYDEMLDSSIDHILVRHEQCAGHMADGFARASGRPGVCLVTSGPGATNVVTGVGTAFADSVPMIALTGQVASGALGLGTFQEVDAFSLMMPVTKYGYRVLELPQLPRAVDEGWKICQIGRPGPVHIDLPVDSMSSEIDESFIYKSYDVRTPRTDLSGLPAAIEAIKTSRKPVILAGGGTIGSDTCEQMVKLAELIGAPVVTPLMGVGAIPYDHPLNLGTLGMHGRISAYSIIKEADLVIALGCKFSDRTYSPHTRVSQGCRIVHVDIDSTEFNKHDAMCVNILGDLRTVLDMMIEGLSGISSHPEWLAVAAGYRARCAQCKTDYDNTPILPQRIMHELNKFIDDDTIVTTDVGQNQMWAMHHLKIRRPRQFISSGSFGTMGFGLPSAIGAKCAFPEKKVVTVVGDGGLLMVMQELATAVAENLPVVICLINNGWLGMVRQLQELFWNKRYSGTKLGGNPDFVKLAEAFGAKGVTVEKPGDIEDAFRQAFASDKPFIVNILADPEEDMVPMLPPNPAIPLVRGRCTF